MKFYGKNFFKRFCAGAAAAALMLWTCGDFPVREGISVFAEDNTVSSETGAFTVMGGTLNTDYSYENNVLTIKSAIALTISGTSTADRIEAESGVNANITLNNVSIDVSGIEGAAAFKIVDNSAGNVTVTLEGTNVLKSGANCAGLQKNGETGVGTLTITGTGSLNAVGGGNGAGIGGSGTNSSKGTGGNTANITIENGTITTQGGAGTVDTGIEGYSPEYGGAGIGGGANGNGSKTCTCSVCGNTKTEPVGKLDHTHKFDAIWHSDGVNHWHECHCGEKSDISLHTEDSGTVTVQPTETTSGTRTFKCTVCGYTMRTESIPTTGYRPNSTPTPTPTPTPNPSPLPTVTTKAKKENVPYIEGNNGKSGWEAISEEIVRTGNTGIVTVDMNGTTELPKNITEEIAGKDIDLILDMGGGISWTINGLTVSNSGTVDMSVTKNTKNITVDVVNNVSGESFTMQISLAHNGEFGFTAKLSIELGKKNDGLYANLFYYNTDKGELEFADCSIIENGKASIEFTHASDYAVVIDSEPLGAFEDVSTAVGAIADGDNLPKNKAVYPVCGAVIIIAVGISAVIFVRRRQK